jgi:hypothetical protein
VGKLPTEFPRNELPVPSLMQAELLRGDTWRGPTLTRRLTRRRKALIDEEVARLKGLRSSGLSLERIGFIVGVSSASVGRVLKSP